MNGVVLVCMILKAIATTQRESDLLANDRRSQRYWLLSTTKALTLFFFVVSIVRGIAAKIGFSPTVLKVFIKGDVQPEDIEKLLNLCAKDYQGPNNSDLTRNRRNSISDYIGKLYTFNNLFRPYRGLKHVQTTETPWLKKFLRGVKVEPKTENFWEMALGAHTFPFSRPLAQTRMPYHRIRDQQRIDKLLGITRNYGKVLALRDDKKPFNWIKNQVKFNEIIDLAKSEEKTTTINDQRKNATTRKAFHRAPLDVAGLKPSFLPHFHALTTRRGFKFCEKQCADEPEEARTRQPQPSSVGESRSPAEDVISTSSHQSSHEHAKTGSCMCTFTVTDCLSDGPDVERECNARSNGEESGSATQKQHLAQAKHTTSKMATKLGRFKLTTPKFTKPKEHRPTGPVWTLPTNSVLDEEKKTEQRGSLPSTRETPEDKTALRSTLLYASTVKPLLSDSLETMSSPGWAVLEMEETSTPSTCKHGKQSKQASCVPMPIPTRLRLPVCPSKPKSTRCTKPPQDKCNSQSRNPPSEDMAISVRDSLEHHHKTPSECPIKLKTTRSTTKRPPDKCDCHTTNPPSGDIPILIEDPLEDHNKKPDGSNKGKPQKIIVRISSALGEVPVVIMRDNGVSGVSLTLVNDYLLDENKRLIKCLSKPLRGSMGLKTLTSSVMPVSHSNVYKSRKFHPHFIRNQLYGLQPKRYSFRFEADPKQRLASRPRASIRTGDSVKSRNPVMNRHEFPGPVISNLFPSYKLNSPDPNLTELGCHGEQYQAIPDPRTYQEFKMEPATPPHTGLNPLGLPIPQNMPSMDGFPGSNIPRTGYPRFRVRAGVDPGMSLPAFGLPGLNLQPVFPRQVADASQLMGYRSPFLPLFYQNHNDARPPKYIIGGSP